MNTVTTLQTPIGKLVCGIREDGALTRLEFADGSEGALAPGGPPAAAPACLDRLARYFDGDLGALDGIEVAPEGTAFQQRVWSELRALRPGETVSYAELARRVGSPRAVRAVGSANARNPVAIVVPCHRVVRSDGGLGGYAGGVERKAWLLGHERNEKPVTPSSSTSRSPTPIPSARRAPPRRPGPRRRPRESP